MRDKKILSGAAAFAMTIVAAGISPAAGAQGFSFGFSTPEGVSVNVGAGGGWQSAPLWMAAPAVVAAPAVMAAPVYYGESPKHYHKRMKKIRKAMRRASSGAWGAVSLPGGMVVNVGVPVDYDDDWYDDDDWDDDHHHHHKYYKKLRKEREKYYKKLHKHHKHHHHKHHHHDDDDDD